MPDFQPIIVEALCRRAKGENIITMADGTPYDFRDDGTGRQVVKVSVEAHAQRLLSITEGYRFAGAALDQPAAPPSHPAPAAAQGIVLPPASGPQGTGEAGTGASDSQKDAAPVTLPDEAALEAMELADVRKQFNAETGKNASPKHSADVLIAQILAVRDTAKQS